VKDRDGRCSRRAQILIPGSPIPTTDPGGDGVGKDGPAIIMLALESSRLRADLKAWGLGTISMALRRKHIDTYLKRSVFRLQIGRLYRHVSFEPCSGSTRTSHDELLGIIVGAAPSPQRRADSPAQGRAAAENSEREWRADGIKNPEKLEPATFGFDRQPRLLIKPGDKTG